MIRAEQLHCITNFWLLINLITCMFSYYVIGLELTIQINCHLIVIQSRYWKTFQIIGNEPQLFGVQTFVWNWLFDGNNTAYTSAIERCTAPRAPNIAHTCGAVCAACAGFCSGLGEKAIYPYISFHFLTLVEAFGGLLRSCCWSCCTANWRLTGRWWCCYWYCYYFCCCCCCCCQHCMSSRSCRHCGRCFLG